LSISQEQRAEAGPTSVDVPEATYFAAFSHIAHKSTVSIRQRLQEFADEVRIVDELGFHYYFTTEHHFSGNFSLSPSQPISLAVIAQNSSRLRFGPMITILPCSQPIRVAEEMVILDHMSGGRLEIGLGRGIRPHEHIAYGVRTNEDQSRLEEGIEFLRRAWTADEKFSWMGEHHTYIDVEMPWRPLQRPYPRLWVPTATPAHARTAGRNGWGTGGFSFPGMALYRPVFEEYRIGWGESGLPPRDMRIAWLIPTIVAETDETARRLMHEHFPRMVSLFEYEASRTYSLVDSAARGRVERSFAMLRQMKEDLDAADRNLVVLCGSPDTVTEKIRFLRDELGVNTVLGEFSFGDLEYADVVRSIELMSTKVMPNFVLPDQVAPSVTKP
jgi:alkanesulfonate monooxygenase SsuD/methylene tetrahydromethanopterin reductase-like flavin-dependent oxidoreductase (luciferase family)